MTVRTSDFPLFTAAEAAVLTQMPLKAVNNAIDKKTIRVSTGGGAGRTPRLLGLRALVSLTLERRLADYFAPDLRRQLFHALEGPDRDRVLLADGLLTVDLRGPRRELAGALRALRRVRDLVISDPEIMGGDPVFRGTRVPVHLVAVLLEKGSAIEELLEDFPRLTTEMVRLAPLYASAYPARGRPKKQPWHVRPPLTTTSRKLASIASR